MIALPHGACGPVLPTPCSTWARCGCSGVYAHDDAYQVAAKAYARVNPTGGGGDAAFHRYCRCGALHGCRAQGPGGARAAEMVALRQEEDAASSSLGPSPRR
ncbi:hypothetical protein QJS66_14020 [Kocuria rhizophila]|nr:hypothetical protein QJS66_14020 [Kocuria rhizophila]